MRGSDKVTQMAPTKAHCPGFVVKKLSQNPLRLECNLALNAVRYTVRRHVFHSFICRGDFYNLHQITFKSQTRI